jgi:hypothetical protein
VFNTNFIHNVLNVAIIVLTGLAGFDWMALGSALGMDPVLAAKIVSGLATVKMVINVIRDGFAGLVKNQPPVA